MLSDKPWKPDAVLRLGAAVLVCFCFGIFLNGLVGTRVHSVPLRVLIAVVCFQGAAFPLIGQFLREHQATWSGAFGFFNDWRRALGAGAIAAVLLAVTTLTIQWAEAQLLARFGIPMDEQVAVQALRETSGWPARLAMAVATILLVPPAEEMLFRGILYPALKHAGFPRFAWWGTAVLFGAVHLNVASFVPLTILGFALIWLYERTDNLLAPIAAHSLFNAANFILLYLLEALSP
ncbi:MAG: CPBP family intramembrane glutamic endopeptidase [Verrucomicrobiota bacterium]